MNPSIAHRFHVGAIGALIVISLVNLNFQYGVEYPEGYTGYRWFGMIYSVVVVALLGVRLRQLITQAVFVSPQTDIERFAVNAGYSLIGLALVLLLTGIIMYFVGGGLSSTLFPQVAIAGFWIGLACIELVKAVGMPHDNVILCDTRGVIYAGREQGMNQWKSGHAVETDMRTLADALDGADVFFGLSAKGAVNRKMVKSMAKNPVIFAMANPDPETPETAPRN